MPPLTDEEAAKLKADYEATAKAKDDELAKLKADIEKLSKKPDPPKEEDLEDKARKERELKAKSDLNVKDIEAAIQFNVGSTEFLKTNAALLPKNIVDIFTIAERETFDNAVQKASAIKAGIISEFFQIQENMDLLTPGLKSALEDYLKLTKNGKQEQAQKIYASVFEPAFEMLKRIKKAGELAKGNGGQKTDSEKQLVERMSKLSREHHLGEKKNA